MRLAYLPAADADLIEIYITIALDDEAAADRLLDRIRAALLRLGDFPESGRARGEIAAGLRSVPIGRYVALYRIIGSEVQVVRVLHSARDFGALFADES